MRPSWEKAPFCSHQNCKNWRRAICRRSSDELRLSARLGKHFSQVDEATNMYPALVPFLSVASIYYVWRGYQAWLARRERLIRNRVAYMLWVAAQTCA